MLMFFPDMHRMRGTGKDVIVMCAIAGMIGCRAEKTVLDRMLHSMRRRGPDGSGIFQEADTSLLHTRLAIIDPEGGRQPMELSWGAENYVIVYNGELYNTQELRCTLMSRGHTFQGHSDTEVLLHAYAEYGEKCVEQLNGIFAFAVWEQKRRRLFLARDRIGVKPLFFTQQGTALFFASEMKTLFAAGILPQLSREGAAQLLLLGPGRLPGSGVFQNVQEMEPGWCGFFEDGKLSLRRYWQLTDREHTDSFEETAECVCYLVKDAVRRQMVSDVPIGTFLSGGLDSSIITAVCAKEMASDGRQLPTFSVDYENNSLYFQSNKFQPDADAEYIQLMAQSFSTDHRATVLTPEDLWETLEEATVARDLPGMADVDFSLLAFCREIRPHVKVALSGECADEIFGGYPWYRDPEVRSQEGFPWAQNTRQRASLLNPGICDDAEDYVMDAYRRICRESDLLPGQPEQEKRMKEMVNLNFRGFMQTLLDRKDRMSMYSGLEVRVPFCDYRIAQYLYSVPWEYKDYRGREKGLLRKAMEGLLPEKVLYRKKSPYPKTFDPRYEQITVSGIRNLMRCDSPLWTIVRKEKIEELLAENNPWPWYGQLMRRPQTAAYFLQMDFWLNYYGVKLGF